MGNPTGTQKAGSGRQSCWDYIEAIIHLETVFQLTHRPTTRSHHHPAGREAEIAPDVNVVNLRHLQPLTLSPLNDTEASSPRGTVKHRQSLQIQSGYVVQGLK